MVASELAMVDAVAFRVARRLPISVDREDLVSIGRLALVAASESYDAGRGVSFGAYARFRVRGAMLDSVRRRHYTFEMHEEIADDFVDDGEEMPAGVVPIDERPDAEAIARSRETFRLIREVMMTLEETERFAILARAEGRTLREIGARFGHKAEWARVVVESARRKLKRSLAMHRLDDRAQRQKPPVRSRNDAA